MATVTAAGSSTSLAPRPVVLTCGCGHDGRLGHNNEENMHTLTPIDFFQRDPELVVKSVHVGGFHAFAQTNKGVYCWGDNTHGQLGLDEKSSMARRKPTLVDFLSNPKVDSPSSRLVSLSCGAYHTVALMADGNLYASGRNDQGQLGLGDTEDVSGFRQVPLSIESLLLSNEDGTEANHPLLMASGAVGSSALEVVDFSCGSFHTLALCRLRSKVEEVAEDESPVGAAAGGMTVVLACGRGDFGELGYEADAWDRLMHQEARVKANIKERAAHADQGGNTEEFLEGRENGSSALLMGGGGGGKQSNELMRKFAKGVKKNVKQRRAPFYHAKLSPMNLGPELDAYLEEHPAQRVVAVQGHHHHTVISVGNASSTPSTWECGCYYCSEIEGNESSQLRRVGEKKEEASSSSSWQLVAGDEFTIRYSQGTGAQIRGKGRLGLGDLDEDWAPEWTALDLGSVAAPPSSVRLVRGVHHSAIWSKRQEGKGDEVVVLGDNYFGQLGTGSDDDCLKPEVIAPFPPPPFNTPGEYDVADVAFGFRHTVVLLVPRAAEAASSPPQGTTADAAPNCEAPESEKQE